MIDILNKIYFMWPYIGIFVFVMAWFLDNDQLKIKLDGVAKFIAAMTIIIMAKLCIWDGQIIPSHSQIKSMSGFLGVFLEDAFFVMIPYYICKKIDKKYIKFLIWAFFSLLFGYGHIYLGLTWAAITVAYPFFISHRYAMKTSFGTVMACHFLYDCFVYLLPKINNLLAMV